MYSPWDWCRSLVCMGCATSVDRKCEECAWNIVFKGRCRTGGFGIRSQGNNTLALADWMAAGMHVACTWQNPICLLCETFWLWRPKWNSPPFAKAFCAWYIYVAQGAAGQRHASNQVLNNCCCHLSSGKVDRRAPPSERTRRSNTPTSARLQVKLWTFTFYSSTAHAATATVSRSFLRDEWTCNKGAQ